MPHAHVVEASSQLNLSRAYQILAYWGVDDHTYTHVSARSSTGDSFFIYPFGLRFDEVTPECLMEVRLNGDVLQGVEHAYNSTGYIVHGSIYTARPDIQWIIHVHTPEIVAVSACEKGLMPLSQWALHFYERVGYHNYDSLALKSDHGAAIAQDLGQYFTVLMRNHGSITCGRTVQEAMFYTYHLQQACKTQCMALAMNQNLVVPPHDVCQQAVKDLLTFENNLGERDWQAWLRCVGSKSNSWGVYE